MFTSPLVKNNSIAWNREKPEQAHPSAMAKIAIASPEKQTKATPSHLEIAHYCILGFTLRTSPRNKTIKKATHSVLASRYDLDKAIERLRRQAQSQ